MQGFINKKYGNEDQILANVSDYAAFGCIVSSEGITANSEGKKIVKAGTPLIGSLLDRQTPFTPFTPTKGTDETDDTATKCAGALLHDVDVTNGDNNGTCLVWGWINTDYLSEDVIDLWTDDVKSALNAKVTLVKGL